MLVQRRLHFLLVPQYVVESSRQFSSTFAIENYLACTNIAVSHALVMHEVESTQDLFGEVLEDGLGHRPYALRQVVQATVGRIVLNN